MSTSRIDPESGNRLPLIPREALDEQGRRYYDAIAAPGTSLVGFRGPGGIWLHHPELGEIQRSFNRRLRKEASLGPQLTELAILVAAREVNHPFEWTVHERAARATGLDPAIIERVKFRRAVDGLGERESIIIRLGREAIGARKVSQATYDEAERVFGRRGLVQLTGLMASYVSTSVILTVFDQQLPPGEASTLPPL